MTSTATATQTPIRVGEARDFPAGVYVVTCYRKTETCYRITVSLNHRVLDAYVAEFDHLLGNLPEGMTGRRAAHEYLCQRVAELAADNERPADVAARTAADYAIADLRRIPEPQQRALAGHRGGVVHHGRGVTVTVLRALAKHHLGRLVYRTDGLRRRVVGVELNKHGRRLADHLTSVNA